MSECVHKWRVNTEGIIRCTKCNADGVDLIIEVHKENADLQQQLTTAQEENVRLRKALQEMVDHEYIIPTSLIDKVKEALSTPPSGGLSELIDAVGKYLQSRTGFMDDGAAKARSYKDMKHAYNKVIGGE
jgi:hypothetical protein